MFEEICDEKCISVENDKNVLNYGLMPENGEDATTQSSHSDGEGIVFLKQQWCSKSIKMCLDKRGMKRVPQ